MTKIIDLFNIEDNDIKVFLDRFSYPYEVLPHIHDYILELGNKLGSDYEVINGNIWIHKTARVSKTCEIIGPCIIMEGAIIRHNAYLRENVIVGKGCVVGNSCEIKNSLLISNAEVPHFNYVGDSILGNKAHLGAGVILSNLRLDKQNIMIEGEDTNLRKIGAFIGDNAQIGCNSVLNPGTVIYPNTIVYPLMNISGVQKDKIVKNKIELRRI